MRDGGAGIASSWPALRRRTPWSRSSTPPGTAPTSTPPRRSSAAVACTEAHQVSKLMRFPTAVPRDPEIEAWWRAHPGELGATARHWFSVIRNCGDDVGELLHDGHPTACVGEAAFAYVNAFRAHVDVGFIRGAELSDPSGLLEGTGKFMRHVKLR